MKPKFNNRLDYRLFIKGTKAFLSNKLGEDDEYPDCPFTYAMESMNVPDKKRAMHVYEDYDCKTYCGGIFKEIISGENKVKGCPCHYFSTKQVRERARRHLSRAIKEYNIFYR